MNICGSNEYGDCLSKLKVNVPININGRTFSQTMGAELDLYLEENTTIERELYKLDPEYFSEYEKYATHGEISEQTEEINEPKPIKEEFGDREINRGKYMLCIL